jgi:hypothetical protein
VPRIQQCFLWIAPALVAVAAGISSAQGPPQLRPIPLTVSRLGIEPREIQVPAGPAEIVVRNWTGLGTIRVERQTGASLEMRERLFDGAAPRHVRRSHHRLELVPGTYVISMVGQPGLQTRLVVTAPGGRP